MASPLVSVEQLQRQQDRIRLIDCRFSLADPDRGEAQYREGHLPGASYLHLERDLSSAPGKHGGRHPLPEPSVFCRRLASLGIGTDTAVAAYDDAGFAFSARLWWMMDALGFKHVSVLDGGFSAWCEAGGELEQRQRRYTPVEPHPADSYRGCVDIRGLRDAQSAGASIVDSREEKRFLGLEEPIDPVAGHIPGAINRPWQSVCRGDGRAAPVEEHVARWLGIEGSEPVVYCGSGVTACVNLLSMRLAGVRGGRLYAGSWSDWCSYL